MSGKPEQERAEVLKAMLHNAVRDVLARWRGADGNKDFVFDSPVTLPVHGKVGRAKMSFVAQRLERALTSGQAVIVIDASFRDMFANGPFKGRGYTVPALRLGGPMLDATLSVANLELEMERALRIFVDTVMTTEAQGSAGATNSFVKVMRSK